MKRISTKRFLIIALIITQMLCTGILVNLMHAQSTHYDDYIDLNEVPVQDFIVVEDNHIIVPSISDKDIIKVCLSQIKASFLKKNANILHYISIGQHEFPVAYLSKEKMYYTEGMTETHKVHTISELKEIVKIYMYHLVLDEDIRKSK